MVDVEKKEHTENGVAMPQPIEPRKPKAAPKTNWISIYIVCLVGFLSGVNFSLFLMSVFPYMQMLNSDLLTEAQETCSTESWWIGSTWYSIVVACFSLMRAISSPIFGIWSDRIKSVRIPMITSCFIIFVGNLTYICAEFAKNLTGYEWVAPIVVLVARLLMGTGAGIVSLTRTYAATTATGSDAATAISLTMAANTLGIAFGPAFNVIFSFMKNYPTTVYANLQLDIFTVPALAGAVFILCAILLLMFVFTESYEGIVQKGGGARGSPGRFRVVPKYDKLAICVLLFVWFAGSFCITNVESMLPPYTEVIYDWDESNTDINTSYILMGSAVVSFFIFIPYSFTRVKMWDARWSIACGCVMMLLFHIISYPYGAYNIEVCTDKNASQCAVQHMNAPELLKWTADINGSSSRCEFPDTQHPGCNNLYSWCDSTPQVPLWLLVVCFAVFFAIGLVQLAAPVGILYARVIGPRRQGVLQGIFAQVASLARIIAPLLMLWLFDDYGPRCAYIVEGALVFIALIVFIIFYRRLIPLKMPAQMKPGSTCKYNDGQLYKL